MDVVCTHIQAPVTFKPMPASTTAEVCMARTRYINPQVTIKTDTTSYTQINLSYNCSLSHCTLLFISVRHVLIFSYSCQNEGRVCTVEGGGGEGQVGMLRQHDSK